MKTRIYVSGKIKKVYRRLDLNPLPEKETMESHLNSWNAHYLSIESKKCWVITHTITRYTVVIPDVSVKKAADLKWYFKDQLFNQFLNDHTNIDFAEDLNSDHFEHFFGDFEFYPTNNNKSCIAYISQRIQDLKWFIFQGYGYEDIPFYSFGAGINEIGTFLRNGKSVYISPVKEMLELIRSNAPKLNEPSITFNKINV